MKKTMMLLYGVVAYFSFFGTILYMIGFEGNLVVPKGIDDGPTTTVVTAMAINFALVFAFAAQHTIMARLKFKEWWTQYVPKPVERSTFVIASSALLMLMFWQWRPIAGTVWSVENTIGQAAIWTLFATGWFLVFYSSFLINHFDLFGLRQVFLAFKNKDYTPVPAKMVSLYKLVRHPLMLGFLITVWATPVMTWGHVYFAAAMSTYIMIGIQFEERTLKKELGEFYGAYQKRTSMLLPIPRGERGTAPTTPAGTVTEGK